MSKQWTAVPKDKPWAIQDNNGALIGTFREEYAHLIAAAPDMYEALEGLLENYKHNKGKGLGVSPIYKAKVALAKARGESHD